MKIKSILFLYILSVGLYASDSPKTNDIKYLEEITYVNGIQFVAKARPSENSSKAQSAFEPSKNISRTNLCEEFESKRRKMDNSQKEGLSSLSDFSVGMQNIEKNKKEFEPFMPYMQPVLSYLDIHQQYAAFMAWQAAQHTEVTQGDQKVDNTRLFGLLETLQQHRKIQSVNDSLPVAGQKDQYEDPQSQMNKDTRLNHICAECGKGFPSQSKLQRHSVVHTKERPFVCNVDGCGRAYTQKGTLDDHILKNHIVKKDTCEN